MNDQNMMRCRVRKSGEGFEGTIYVSGMKPTKLVKKDETSTYANRSGVTSAAKALAERFGMDLEVEDTSVKKEKTTGKTTAPTAMAADLC